MRAFLFPIFSAIDSGLFRYRCKDVAIPDEQLIALFRDRNDLDAVEILLGRYQDSIFGFLLSVLRKPHDTEDALRETLF